MATSAYPSLASQSPMTQMMAHSALKMSEAAGLLVPPIYVAVSLIRAARGRGAAGAGFSVRGLMRASTRGVVIAAPLGAGAAWGMLRNEPLEAVEDRCYRLVSRPFNGHERQYAPVQGAWGGARMGWTRSCVPVRPAEVEMSYVEMCGISSLKSVS